jgi:hypothetical protein
MICFNKVIIRVRITKSVPATPAVFNKDIT